VGRKGEGWGGERRGKDRVMSPPVFGGSLRLCHLYALSLLKVKTSQPQPIRRPRHEEQRQGNVRSNTDAITGEAMSSQDLKSTRFAVSAINSTYVI